MNIIEKLSKIDIKDLKNIDINQIKETVKNRPDILIIIVLIGATLFATISICVSKINEAGSVNNNIAKMNQRLAAFKESVEAKKNYDDFIANFPKVLPNDQFITKLSEYADNNKVRILDFSQPQEKGDALVKYTSVNLNITSPNLSNITRFIKDIESSPYAIRVEKWLGKLNEGGVSQNRFSENTGNKQSVEANIDIVWIQIKK